jgi:PAP2 superfamily protein
MNTQTLIWGLIALTGAVDYVLFVTQGMAIVNDWSIALLLLTLFCLSVALERHVPPVARLIGAFAQLFAFSQVGGLLTYAAMAASPFPLADGLLNHADTLVGFDWTAWFDWLQVHPMLHFLLAKAYNSIPYQLAGLLFYFAYADAHRLDELIVATIFSVGIATIGMIFLPALGAWTQHGIGMVEPWRDDIIALRDHAMRTVRHTQGIIAFPSFHTAAAVLLVNMTRGYWFFVPVLVVNLAMITSVMTEGAHYGADMLSGLVLAGASISAARGLLTRCQTVRASWLLAHASAAKVLPFQAARRHCASGIEGFRRVALREP